MWIRRLFVFPALAAALALPATAHAQAPIVMKLGTATINDAQHEWMKRFADIVHREAGGKIKVEIYPSSQLGGSPRMVEQTQTNTIQGVVGPPEFLAGVDQRFSVLSAPGLFEGLEHANRTLQDPAFNKAFLALGADKGLKGLGLFISGPTVFVTRKPVTNLKEIEGLKLRVLAAPLQLEQIRALKGAPIPMPLGEVLPALQQGALDGVMSCIPVFVALKYADAAKYMLETNHGLISAATIISKTWFDGLPPQLQEIVVKAGQKASEEIYQFSVDDINNGREAWKKAGGQVVTLSPEEHKQMMTTLLPVGSRVTEKTPAEKAMFDLLQQTAQRNKK